MGRHKQKLLKTKRKILTDVYEGHLLNCYLKTLNDFIEETKEESFINLFNECSEEYDKLSENHADLLLQKCKYHLDLKKEELLLPKKYGRKSDSVC